MSKKVDERVVEMRFDNKQFESATKESMSTLDKLKQKLQLKDATKGLNDLEKAAQKVDLNPLGKAADAVAVKFSYMQTTIQHQLNNIVDSAVNAGKNIVKALTIEPVMTGFDEYNTQMGAIQTILANTQKEGTNVQQVNAALDELNLYADQTIYNFTEMTKNIGTFTAAGVKLKDSVSSIKGIANLAAVSGSTSLQASTAMYQLSQALAAGKVTLMDWNSVVNAGMGGQVFQDALVRTSEHLKTGAKQAIATYGTFRESLTQGEWLTKEVLTETLTQLSGAYSEADLIAQGYTEEQAKEIAELAETAKAAATEVKTFPQLWDTMKESVQSGWGVTWRTIIGDFEEAKILLTDISERFSKMIEASSEARNNMLSEGLSSGWKQLIDAGIPNEEDYKDVFKSIAKEHGTSIDEMIKAEQKLSKEQNGRTLKDGEAFQKALKRGFSEGTLSADMLSESVQKMTEKIDNMSEEELKAAGYTSEHVEQIEALSSGLKNGSISMDEFVKKMTRSSGRENLIQALWNSFDGLMNIITPIKEAFREIFPRTTGDQLYDLTVKIENVTAKFKELTEKNAPQLKATFKGIFSVISVGVNIVKAIIGGIATLIGKLTGFSGGILDVTGSIGDWLSKMSAGINEANLFGKAIDGIVGFLGGAIDAFKEFTGAIKEKVTANGFEWFFELMQKIGNVIQRVSKAVGTVAVAIGKALGNAFSNGDFKSLLDILNGGLFASILLGINKIVKKLKGVTGADVTKSLFGTITEIPSKIKDVLGSVQESLESWQKNLQSETIKNIAIAIGILAASLWVLSGIDSDKMGTALGGIGTLMGELMGAMFLFTKITADAKSVLKGTPALIGIAAAIFILASALKKLADLNWGQLAVGLTGIAGLIGILTVAMIALLKFTNTSEKIFNVSKKGIFSKKSQNHLISVGLAMIAMAAAVKILASACKDLSGLNWNEIGVGLTGIVVLLGSAMGAMITLSKTTSNSKGLMTIGLAMIAMAAAMKILASACKDLSELNWDELKVGLSGIVVMLGVVTGAMIALSRFTSKTGEITKSSKDGIFNSKSKQNLISIGLAMVAMAAAMKIMASAANDFAEMKWDGLAKAGAAMTVILGLSTLFLKFAGKAENMKATIASLLLIGAAMEIFAHVAGIFGNMEWPDLGKAGLAITGILALVLGFSAIAGKIGGIMESATALLVVAAALLVLTPVIKTLGSMSLGQVATALIALAGALAIFIGAAKLIKTFNLGPVMTALAGSIALIGLACLAAGAGIMMFAAGFTALAAAGAAGAASFVAAITIIIVGILNLIPSIVDQLTAAIVAICNVIIQSAPAIGEALLELVKLAITVIGECAPQIAEASLQLLVKALELLIQYTPQIRDLLLDFLLAVINGLTARLPELVTALANLITTLINSLAEHVPEFVAAWVNLFGAIIQGIADAIGPILDIISDVFSKLLDSIAKVLPGIADVINSVGNVIEKFFNGLSGVIESVGNAALNSGKGFKELAEGIKTITDLPILDMGASLAAVALGIGKIAKSSKGLDKAGEGMKKISDATKLSADSFNSIASGVSTVLSAFNSIGESAESAVTSMVNAFTNAKGPMESSTSSIMTASINAIKNSEGKFSNSGKAVINKLVAALNAGVSKFTEAGKYLVDGFAKGITENTFKAEAKAKAMADAALTAARAKLKVESPSKEFMKVGAFVVAGFAKGISKNVGDANKASVKMANGVLESTQDALGIHSPSVVFDKKVGRYIVQGIAEGIKKDMSAEEAAKKKADNIVSAFKNELDKIDQGISNRGKDFDLWQLTDGKTASDVATLEKQRKKLNDNLWDYNQEVKLSTDKYLLLKKTFGENADATLEAYGAMRDAQIKAAQIAEEYTSIDSALLTSQEENIEKRMTLDEKKRDLFNAMESDGTRRHKILSEIFNKGSLESEMKNAAELTAIAQKEYDSLLAKGYSKDSSVVLDAAAKLVDRKTEEQQAKQDYYDYINSTYDDDLQKIEDSQARRSREDSFWEATYGDDASDAKRFAYYAKRDAQDVEEAGSTVKTLRDKYDNFIKEYARLNKVTLDMAKQSDEAKAIAEDLENAQVSEAEAKQKQKNRKKEYLEQEKADLEQEKADLEQEKADLKEEYELVSEIADIKYQIWEKTSGRNATDAEKDTMKLAFLTQQLDAQAKLVEMAKDAWENADADEAQKLEKEYWSAQLELANLQSEVLDIQEENVKRQERALDRQRNAQSEYTDYIKKYEKYYLEHGMTKEELERDAKLVSGYDPSKVVDNAVSKTNTAIDSVKTNVSNLTKAVGEGIQNGISDVTDNMTSMLKSCADVLNSEKDTWAKAGAAMVDGLIQGITSKTQSAVNSVTDLVTRMLAAIQEVCENGMDYTPTITPVLDMSNVSSGVSSLNSMINGKTSFGLASSVSKLTKDTISRTKSQSDDTQKSGTTYSFTQNNYSPKALSSSEIYRQNKNMISRAIEGKGLTQ